MGKYHEAVQALDQFTKAFCRDKSVKDDLVFRCSECVFKLTEKNCLIKLFKCKYEPDFKDFGCTGDL